MTDKELTPTEQRLGDEIQNWIDNRFGVDNTFNTQLLIDFKDWLINHFLGALAQERGYKSPEQIKEIVEEMKELPDLELVLINHPWQREMKTKLSVSESDRAVSQRTVQSCKEQMLKQVSTE